MKEIFETNIVCNGCNNALVCLYDRRGAARIVCPEKGDRSKCESSLEILLNSFNINDYASINMNYKANDLFYFIDFLIIGGPFCRVQVGSSWMIKDLKEDYKIRIQPKLSIKDNKIDFDNFIDRVKKYSLLR